MIARRVVIRGRVQGVGYRYAMVETAEAHGLVGWVRNRRDGTVETLLQGDADAVERAIAWCRQGPRQARVTAVEIIEESVAPSMAGFTLRHTE